MLFRKLITYLLLLVYGVPASLGPYWHDHHEHAGACHHESSIASERHDAPSHHNHCCHHDSEGVLTQDSISGFESNQTLDRSGDQIVRQSLIDGHGSCAICAFYAAAKAAHWHSIAIEFRLASTAIALADSSEGEYRAAAERARGPPSFAA